MRVLLTLTSLKNAVYDIRANHKMQGFVYSLLKSSEYSSLHDQRGDKFFCFSNLFPIGDIKEGQKRSLLISSPNEGLIKHVEEQLSRIKDASEPVNIGDYQFTIDSLKTLRIRTHPPLRIAAATPIVIRIPEYRYEKHGISLPFAPYPRSHAASNWLGLPNDGDEMNSQRAAAIERREGCPVGWSVTRSPDFTGEEQLRHLVESMKRYERAGLDFLELDESCPNTRESVHDDLAPRLRHVKEYFLERRPRRLPVVVKFSTDTEIGALPRLLDLLFELGYDGVNFGNTSSAYARRRELIAEKERRLYDYFTTDKRFGVGGGVSGRPLKASSLELARGAVTYHRAGPPSYEFHVIRTGGIETADDIRESDRAGVSLHQWYTGYFEQLARHGHGLYRRLYEEL